MTKTWKLRLLQDGSNNNSYFPSFRARDTFVFSCVRHQPQFAKEGEVVRPALYLLPKGPSPKIHRCRRGFF